MPLTESELGKVKSKANRIGDHDIVYGKKRRLYARATNKADAERDKRILERRGFHGIATIRRKGHLQVNNRWLPVTVYEIWAIGQK